MQYKKLLEVKPGKVLVFPARELAVAKVVKYKGTTSSWINVVGFADTGREIVLETEDRKVRVWLEQSLMPMDAETMAPITGIDVEVIIHGNHRFELDEGPSRAKTVTITKDGEVGGKLRFSVFCPEDDEESDERISIEEKEGRLVVYYSVGFIPLKDIQVK